MKEDHSILFIVTTHPSWGRANFLRVLHLTRQLKNCRIIDLRLPQTEEIIEKKFLQVLDSYSNLIFFDAIDTITSIHSLSGFSDYWNKNTFSAVVFDRREIPPLLIDVICQDIVPIIVFDVRRVLSYLPSLKQKSYINSMAKVDYVINTIPSLEKNWANLTGLEYWFSSSNISKKKSNEDISNLSEKKDKEIQMIFYPGRIIRKDYLLSSIKKIKTAIGFLRMTKYFSCDSLDQKICLKVITDRSNFPKECEVIFDGTRLDELNDKESGNNIEVQQLDFHEDTQKFLVDTSVVFTHFGFLAWEVLAQQIPVFFLSPSDYHGCLAKKYFPELIIEDFITKCSSLPQNLENGVEKMIDGILSKLLVYSQNIGESRKGDILPRVIKAFSRWPRLEHLKKCKAN